MSYESTKTNSNLGASETMASDMPSQSNNTNFYTNNTNRGQTMMMNSMANAGNYYNGPATAPPTTTTTGSAPPPTGPAGQQQNQSANRPMYQSYPPSTAPHPPHHPIVSFALEMSRKSNSLLLLWFHFLQKKPNERTRRKVFIELRSESVCFFFLVNLFSCHHSIPTTHVQLDIIPCIQMTLLLFMNISKLHL